MEQAIEMYRQVSGSGAVGKGGGGGYLLHLRPKTHEPWVELEELEAGKKSPLTRQPSNLCAVHCVCSQDDKARTGLEQRVQELKRRELTDSQRAVLQANNHPLHREVGGPVLLHLLPRVVVGVVCE